MIKRDVVSIESSQLQTRYTKGWLLNSGNNISVLKDVQLTGWLCCGWLDGWMAVICYFRPPVNRRFVEVSFIAPHSNVTLPRQMTVGLMFV